MSFWDDISDKLSEVDFNDVISVFATDDAVRNQAPQVEQTRAAQGESYYQPTHGSTADGRPVLANSGAQMMPWYQDPLKAGGALVIVAGLIVLVVKVAK